MNTFLVSVLICANLGVLVQSNNLMRLVRQSSTCSSKYQALGNSVMCLSPSANYIADSAGVSAADKATILQMHNNFRKAVNPNAKAMQKMYWDDNLAITAEQWAKQCVVGHDTSNGYSRFIPDYGMNPGQNAAYGYSSWTNAITGWHDEVADFTYGQATSAVVGHYTQVVKDTSIRIGCGYAKCTSGYQHFYICNYLTGQSNYLTPYELGASCSACQGQCVDGKLCDCGGTFCYNGGNLNLETCGCTCPSPFIGSTCLERACNGKTCLNGGTLDINACTCSCTALYTGDTCQTKVCPAEDPWFCTGAWDPSFCERFSNVPDDCPNMCGQC